MKTIAVRLDGLLVEDVSAIPNADPIPAAVQLVQTLARGGAGQVLMITSAPEAVTDEMIRGWLNRYQIPWSDLVRLTGVLDWREEDEILSAVGARATVLGLYLVASHHDTLYMADHGVPTIAFVHADPVIDYRPQRGRTWAAYGFSEEEA
jgi:hypothetical protein